MKEAVKWLRAMPMLSCNPEPFDSFLHVRPLGPFDCFLHVRCGKYRKKTATFMFGAANTHGRDAAQASNAAINALVRCCGGAVVGDKTRRRCRRYPRRTSEWSSSCFCRRRRRACRRCRVVSPSILSRRQPLQPPPLIAALGPAALRDVCYARTTSSLVFSTSPLPPSETCLLGGGEGGVGGGGEKDKRKTGEVSDA
jgi:hypothetical protein